MRTELILVDDDAILLMILQKMIIKQGFHTSPNKFLNGKLALDYIKSNDSSDTNYLVLLDLNMPIMSGWDFLESIGKEAFHSTIRVVILTSSVDKRDRDRAAVFSHVIHFLEKPISESKIKLLSDHPLIQQWIP
jgi:CheY-like chemotaxis protein